MFEDNHDSKAYTGENNDRNTLHHLDDIDFIESFPALLWKVDVVKNKIEFLNKYEMRGLYEDTGLLLKNMNFSRKVIYREDFYLFEAFMKKIREARPGATVFRIWTKDNETRWVKLLGMISKKNPEFYIGGIIDITGTSEILQSIATKEAESQAMIEFADNPVLLIDLETKSVLAHNKAASDLLAIKPAEFRTMNFSDIYDHSMGHYIDRIYEALLFENKWTGTLILCRKPKTPFFADTSMRPLWLKGKQVIRVSIHDVRFEESITRNHVITFADLDVKVDLKRQYQEKLITQVDGINDIVQILNILLKNQFDKPRYDAIMFSDIYSKKNKVTVYTAGGVFKKLKQGETFPYEGTIAENIQNFNLEYLIVEDTFSSMKPIDWALFIPYGIRSYFAKAFYSRKVMRAVLILCSLEPQTFKEDKVEDYSLLYKSFLKGLANWRHYGLKVRN